MMVTVLWLLGVAVGGLLGFTTWHALVTALGGADRAERDKEQQP